MEIALSENIGRFLNDNHMSQRKFARLVGVSEAAICGYLYGTRNPQLLVVCEIANVMGVTLDELVWKKMD